MSFNVEKKEVKRLACEICENKDCQPASSRKSTEKL